MIKVLDCLEKLEGKTIEKVIDLEWNGHGVFLITGDKEVVCLEAERDWSDGAELKIHSEKEVINTMIGSMLVIDELAKVGAIDKNQVMIEKEKIDEAHRLKYEAANEKREKEQYERLKKKFESK